MKKINALLTLFIICLGISLTSCNDDDYYGPPGVTSYDPDLVGVWELYSADGVRVHGFQVNWLEFYSDGYGAYYYYYDGVEYNMGLAYATEWYNGSSQLYIDYEDGRRAAMEYWYSGDYSYLYTQWYDRGYRHTYVYRYVGNTQWAPKKKAFEKAPAHSLLPSLTPGLPAPADTTTTP